MDTQRRWPGGAGASSRTLISALALTALVGSAGCGASSPSAASTPVAPVTSIAPSVAGAQQSAEPGGDWIGFHGDASRSGLAVAGPVGHAVLSWQAHAKGGVPNTIAIVGDAVYFASDDGVIHALDRATGTERWTTTLGGPTQRGPVAADGRLYLMSDRGAPVALDPSTGHALWTGATAYQSPSEVASDGSSLYFGTGDGFLVAVDAATGTERWRLRPSPATTAVHSPAFAGGRIFAGTDGGGYVAVDATSHQVAWTGDLQGDNTGTAAVAGNLAFIGTAVDTPSGHLRAFDAGSGKLRWMSDQPLLQFPTIGDGVAYSANQEGLVAALDLATGSTRWTVHLQGKVRPMAVAGSTLYLGADQEHKVYALDAATGGKLWSFDVDGSNDCCIAVAHGSVFVGTLAGSVYSIAGDGAQVAAVPFDTAAPSVAPAGPGVVAELAASVTWSTGLDPARISPICQIAFDPSGHLWVPEAAGNGIEIFSPAGKLLETWSGPGGQHAFDFSRQNGDGYGTLAFARDGSFYVLDVGNRRVQHFDAKRKFVNEWGGFGNGPGQFNDPIGIGVGPDGSVWVADDRRSVVEHYDPKGRVLGSFDPFASLASNEGANSLLVDARGRIYVTSAAPSEVLVFDASGTLLETLGSGVFAEQATDMAIDAAGRIFVTQGEQRGSAPGVLAFGPDGTLLGGFAPEGTGKGQVAFPAGIAVDPAGGVIVEDSVPDSARLIRFDVAP